MHMLVYINYESWYILLVKEYLVRYFGKKSRAKYLAWRERGGENRIVTNLTLCTLHHILSGGRNWGTFDRAYSRHDAWIPKHEGKRSVWTLVVDEEDNTEIYLTETGCGCVDWIHVVQERF